MSPTRGRSLRRWLVRLVVALALLRLVLAVLLPWLVDFAAGFLGLTVAYRSASLSLHRLSLRFEDLVANITEDADAPPLFTAQEVTLDASTWQLLHGDLVVVDVAVSGGRIHVQQKADGTLRLPATWRSDNAAVAPAAVAPEAVAPAAAANAEPVHFQLPVQIVSARLHDLRITHEDLGAVPPQWSELTIDFDATDIGRPDKTGTMALRLRSPAWFDDLWVQANATTTDEQFALRWQGAVRGVRPISLPLPAAAQPMWQNVHTLGLDVRGDLHARRFAAKPWQAILDGNLQLTVTADTTQLVSLEIKAGDSQATATGHELPFTIAVHGDEVVDDLRLQNGRLELAGGRTSLAMDLECRNLSLRFFRPWLESLGCTLPPVGVNASAAVRVDHGMTADTPSLSAGVTKLAVWHGEDRLALERIAVTDLRHVGDGVAIGAIEIDGPELSITALPHHGMSIAGIQLHTPPTQDVTPAVQAAPDATASTLAWPRVALERLDWSGLTMRFIDTSLPQPATLHLTEGTVHGENLGLGQALPPGRLVATCMLPDAIGGVRAELHLRPEVDAATAELELTANDMTLRALAPWLQQAGITPALQNGRLRALASVQLASTADGFTANARVANVRLEEGEDVLLGLGTCEVRDLRRSRQSLDLGTWTTEDPYLAVQRNADGAVTLLGLQFGPTVPAATTAPALPSSPTAPTTAATSRAPSDPVASQPLLHGRATLRRGLVRWIDATGPRACNLSLGIDVVLGANDGKGTAVEHEVTFHVDQAIESLQLRGTSQRTPSQMRIDTSVVGKGIQGAGFASLLPAHAQCTLHDGALEGHLQADLSTGLALRVRNVKLLDRGQEVCGIDALTLDLPRIAKDFVHIANMEAKGVRATAVSTTEGLLLPGLLLRQAAATAAASGGDEPALAIPALRIDAVDLQLERLEWRERKTADGQPVVATGRIRLAAPWATADDPAETPAAKLVLTAAIEPFCRDIRIESDVAPFDTQPTLDLTVQARGIDTTALPAVMPSLANRIAGTTSSAEFSCGVHARWGLRRRSVLLFDLGRPFGGELVVQDLRLQEAGKEPLLLGAEEIRIEARSFDPRTGDLLLRSVEIDAPVLRAERTSSGLDLLGVRLLSAPTAAGSTTAPSAPAAPAAAAATAPPVAAAAAPELSLDRLRVQSLGFEFTDRTTTPVTHLPLQDVELVLQNVSSRTLHEQRPIDFSLTISGGQVELEGRVLRSSVIAGLLGSAAEALTGSQDKHAMEQRALVDEMRLVGKLVLHPKPTGQVRTAVRSLELQALRGLAKTGGVDLTDGLMDFDMQADLRDDGAQIVSRTTFTWLSMTEPPGGPISTYLRLPAPLDTVIFLLRNDSDEHVLPISLSVPPDGIGDGAIAAAAVEALVRILADAIASAAFRAAGSIIRTVTRNSATDPLPSAQLSFAPGETVPEAGLLDEVLAALAADPELGIVLTHELGGGDLQRAAELANPPSVIVADSLTRWRGERASLARYRAQVASDVVALFAAGKMQDARSRHRELAMLDERLGRLELTVDETLGMLAGESSRRLARRTQNGALAMAESRLEAVRQMVVARLGDDFGPRIEWRRPRAVEAADRPKGGRVAATLRRRSIP